MPQAALSLVIRCLSKSLGERHAGVLAAIDSAITRAGLPVRLSFSSIESAKFNYLSNTKAIEIKGFDWLLAHRKRFCGAFVTKIEHSFSAVCAGLGENDIVPMQTLRIVGLSLAV